MRITEKDNNAIINLEGEKKVVLELLENPSTGYMWELEKNNSVEIISDTIKLEGSRTGESGKRELSLKFTNLGICNLEFKHWRNWEGEDSVIARFKVTVVVD